MSAVESPAQNGFERPFESTQEPLKRKPRSKCCLCCGIFCLLVFIFLVIVAILAYLAYRDFVMPGGTLTGFALTGFPNLVSLNGIYLNPTLSAADKVTQATALFSTLNFSANLVITNPNSYLSAVINPTNVEIAYTPSKSHFQTISIPQINVPVSSFNVPHSIATVPGSTTIQLSYIPQFLADSVNGVLVFHATTSIKGTFYYHSLGIPTPTFILSCDIPIDLNTNPPSYPEPGQPATCSPISIVW